MFQLSYLVLGERKLLRRTVSRIVLTTLLLTSMLTVVLNIGLVKSETYYYDFMIVVSPESPIICDEVDVTVVLAARYANLIVVFSPLLQSDEEFFVTVNVYAPEGLLPAPVCEDETYSLGRLPEDSYTFNVDVKEWRVETGMLVDEDSYSTVFTVTSFLKSIVELKTKIEEFGVEGEIAKGTVRSLIAKLNLAQKMVDREKIDEAQSVLENFIKQVQNLSGIHITPEAADILIKSAEYIISHLTQ